MSGPLGMLAGPVINTAMGLALEKHNDKRQLRQHRNLGVQQLGLNIQQMKAQKDADLDFWNKTNYGAQLQHMKNAGLSPGLMYGGSGQGGSAVGGSGGNVSSPTPPIGGGEIMGLQLMGAQKKLLEAQANKTNVEADKTAGVDTELTKAQGDIARIEASLAQDTYQDTQNKVMAEAEKMIAEARIASSKGQVQHETEQTQILIKEGELMGISIANELKREGVKLTQAQIESTVEGVKQKWAEIAVKKGKLDLDRFIHDIADSTKLTVETATKIVTNLTGVFSQSKIAHWRNATEIEKAVIKSGN